jgi:hypothetical protein
MEYILRVSEGFLEHDDAIRACWESVSHGRLEAIEPVRGELAPQRTADGEVGTINECTPNHYVSQIKLRILSAKDDTHLLDLSHVSFCLSIHCVSCNVASFSHYV